MGLFDSEQNPVRKWTKSGIYSGQNFGLVVLLSKINKQSSQGVGRVDATGRSGQ
jgi:hypothetical protein